MNRLKEPQSYLMAGGGIIQHLGASIKNDMNDYHIVFDLWLPLSGPKRDRGFNVFTNEGAKMAAEELKKMWKDDSQEIDEALKTQLKWNAHQRETKKECVK